MTMKFSHCGPHNHLGLYHAGAALLEEALKKREVLLGPEHPDIAEACARLGDVYQKLGRYAEAEALLRRAVAIQEAGFPPNATLIADSLTSLGNLYQIMGRFNEAQPVLDRALAIRVTNEGDDAGLARTLNAVAVLHRNVALALENLGRILARQHHYEDAEASYRQALAIFEKTMSIDDPYVADTLHDLGELYHELKRDDRKY
jgi:tetratricopeptide (TPR) repeat protein